MKIFIFTIFFVVSLFAFDFGALLQATTTPSQTTEKKDYVVDGYNKTTALLMANVADAVFKVDFGKSGFKNAGITYDGYYEVKEGLVDLQFAFGHRGNYPNKMDIFISIRGSKEKMDWFTDINYLSSEYDVNIDKKITVHSGFLSSANLLIANEDKAKVANVSLKDLIAQNIKGQRNDNFFITGHSLGGAVATIYSTKLLDRGLASNKMTIYTFGAPPVSMDEGDTKNQMNSFSTDGKIGAISNVVINSAFGSSQKGTNYYIDKYSKLIKIYRVYDSHDLVPKLVAPARHLGIEVMYVSDIPKKDLLNKEKLWHLHFMSNYINHITKDKPQDPTTKSGGFVDLIN